MRKSIAALLLLWISACRCDDGGLQRLRPSVVVLSPTQMDSDEWVLDFGLIPIGDKTERAVTIGDQGNAAAAILSFALREGSDPAFSLPATLPAGTIIRLAPGSEHSIAIDASPASAGALSGHLDITTDDPARAAIHVKLIATATTTRPNLPCALDVQPGSASFSVTMIGFEEGIFTATSTQGTCTVSSAVISGSDSFTLKDPPSPPVRLALGESTKLDVLYKPTGPSFPERATLDIGSDDPRRPKISIPLSGTVVPPPFETCLIRFEPKPLDFGRVSVGATARRHVAIWNFGTAACDYRSPTILPSADSEDFSIRIAPLGGGAFNPLTHLDADISFTPSHRGEFSATALVIGTIPFSGSNTSSDTEPLSGRTGDPRLCVMPEELDFGTVQPGSSKDLSFAITSCGDAQLAVRGVMLGVGTPSSFALHPAPQVPIELAAHTSSTVMVRFQPTTSGAMRGLALVLGNDPMTPSATVRLKGNAPDDCNRWLVCSPMSIGLSRTVVGRSASTHFVCTNAGPSDVTVSAVSIAQGTTSEIAVTAASPLPAMLHPGAQLRATVTYTPTDVGPDMGQIEIDSDSCQATLLLGVSAEGKADDSPPCIPPTTFMPTVRWTWQSPPVEPTYDKVTSSPVVVNLIDHNGDGFINADDVPDVLFPAFPYPGNTGPSLLVPSVIRAIRGDDASEVWSIVDPSQRTNWGVQLAAGDLDGDGIAEVLVPLGMINSVVDQAGHGKFRLGRIQCFDHLGALRWVSDPWHRPDSETEDYAAPSIADLDGDGSPEIILGASVFDASGHLLWEGRRGIGTAGFGPLSAIADLDGDGKMEIIGGSTAYKSDGSILWDYQEPPALTVDGHPIVIDTDGDGRPEVVLRTAQNRLVTLNADGTIKSGPFDLPMVQGCQSPVAAGDFDGDRLPELAIAAGDFFYVVRPGSGAVVWSQPIDDYIGQCGAAGPAVFDFNGDGRQEIVYMDAHTVWIFNGPDGRVLFQMPRDSATLYETPVIADVDGDGHAEILVSQWAPGGLKLVSDVANDWSGTRKIWNQHGYHVTNIDEGGIVPRLEGPGWTRFNGWRGNITLCR
jgi:hypothetical protein